MINYFWIEIKGKNPKRLLTNIFKLKINIDSIKYKQDRILLKVSYEDYQKIKKIKTTYEINIIKTSGKKRIIDIINKYKISLLMFGISVFFVILLSNFILYINIETDNNNLKRIISNELDTNHLTLFTLKKSYSQLNDISNKIQTNNLDKIEWLEISQKGVKLEIKVIERVTTDLKKETGYKDIAASKNGYIRKIYSSQGQILKNIDDYVKKGEVIISGNIFRNEKVVSKVKAKGKVYAEVWYIVKANKSFNHLKPEENQGNLRLSLTINNYELSLITIPKTVKVDKDRILYQTKTLKLNLKEEKKYTLQKSKYSQKELVNILETKAKNSILQSLEKDEYIIEQKTLKKYPKNDKMYVEVFFKTYEDIAKEQDIAEIKEEKEE